MLKLGVIGYGSRIHKVVEKLVKSGKVELVAVNDLRTFEEIKNDYLNEYLGEKEIANINFYSDSKEMLDNEKLDGVCIGTRCSTHTELACLVAEYDVPFFLEKPVATNEEDLNRLKGLLHMNDKIVVSFPFRLRPLVTRVKEIIDTGVLGQISQVQAINNVPYGGVYFHNWYRDESITGGLFLQKATHDFDYINYLLGGLKPVRICASTTKNIFTGNKPANLKCEECSERNECKEYGVRFYPGELYCCFAEDTGNEDCGSAIIEYENGIHASYTQNFVARKDAATRGSIIVGYDATLEFDIYTNKIKVHHHWKDLTEEYNFPTYADHGGGDDTIVKNFIGVMEGTEKSVTPLTSGILSVTMCLAAKKSAKEHKFFDIV